MTNTISPTLLTPLEVPRTAKPWTQEQILAALEVLPRASGLLAPVLALALPSTVVPTMAVALSSSSVRFREVTLPVPPPRVHDVVETVLELLDHTIMAGDIFSDPAAPPATWTRLLRSGARNVLFSATELFGLPFLAADPSLPENTTYAYLHAILSGLLSPGPARCSYEGVTFTIEGERASVLLVPEHARELRSLDPIDRVTLGEALATRLGATLLEVDVLGSDVAYTFCVDDCTVLVHATLGGGAAVGYRGDLVPTGTAPASLPDGWLGLGPSVSDKGWVALHLGSRTRALIN